ncbi:MAG: BTAD domain-containing putative transcriptional regulator, partial [Acidimicrobiia bacterium]
MDWTSRQGGHDVEFRILGPLEVTGPGGTASLGASREGALLARLILSANRVVSLERLVDDLWESDPPAKAPGALQVYVSRLRKVLRGCGIGDVLLTQSPGYVLALGPDFVDAVRFEALVARGRRQSERGDHRAAAETLRSALALWRGPALADVADAPFARAEAARLEEGRVAALEERIDADLACGRHGELIGELAALLSEHPLRERLWSQRMVALYRAGRQAEALRSYQELRRVLGEDLGIEPSTALRRLEADILRHEPELDWTALDAPAPAAPSPVEPGSPAPPAASGAVVTFLFTDVVGSTRLLEELGEDEAEELRRRHFALLREAVAGHGGTEVKTLGDGLMVAFDSPLAGLGCAVAMQRALHAPAQGQARALPARVGLHAGEPLREDEDFFGTPVVVAKRLCDGAEGGQILVSGLLRDLVGRRGGYSFRDLGGLSLKGLAEPVATYEVVWSTAADAGLAPPAGRPALPLALGQKGRVPLVGRDEELARLEAAWSAASSGERRVVLVAGEPGIGKSRLAAEVARRAHSGGGIVCFGRCDEGMGVPYQPFVEAVGGYVREAPAPAVGRLAGELVRLVPEVASRVRGLPPPLRSDPETERYRLFDAVAAWLAAASESAPVLLVVDDLHWATTPTIQLLRHLVRSGETLALLAVVAYRDTAMDVTGDLADTVAELLREPGVERLSLSGLDEAGVAAFMAARAGHELDDDARALAAVLHAETAGNPFFVGEVLNHLTEHGTLVRREGRWGTERPLVEVAVPEGVAEVVRRRLARLPEETNEVLVLAAVLGERFELPALVEASGMPEIATTRALEPALAARLVRETGIERYQFAHALVRSTLEKSLGPTRRAALHAAAGRAVETLHAGDLDAHLAELAHHFARTGDHTKGIDYATRAGDRALALLAHHEAANHYAQALELFDVANGAGDERRRCDLLLSLGEAQRQAGDAIHRETLLEAANLAQRLGDTGRLVRAALANSRGTAPSTA